MRILIVGASTRRSKYGNMAVRAYQRRGHEVLAVNPNEPQVEGLRTYADVRDAPGPIDRATLYVPPHVGLGIVESLAARGDVAELFLNPSTDSPQLVERARQLGLKVTFGCAILDIGEVPG